MNILLHSKYLGLVNNNAKKLVGNTLLYKVTAVHMLFLELNSSTPPTSSLLGDNGVV